MFRLFALLLITTLSFSSIANDLNQQAWRQAISAIKAGDADKLDQIITTAPEIVTYYSGDSYTLINYAVTQDQHHTFTKKTLLTVLKKHGAPFEANVANGMTPLNRLFQLYSEDHEVAHMAELLIPFGPKAVNIKSNEGLLPIFGRIYEKTAKVLIEAGADVNALSPTGWTPLMWHVSQGNHEIVKLLLNNGAKVNVQDEGGNTALHFAAKVDSFNEDSFETGTRRVKIYKTLLEHGASVNIKNNIGETPLMKAAHWSRLAAIRLLLQHNADAKAVDNDGLTVLHHFAKFGVMYYELDFVSYPGENDGGNQFIVFFKAIANELIQKGADLSIKSASGETALDIAHKNNRDDIATALSQLTKT